jgi:predicted phage replisome organizer
MAEVQWIKLSVGMFDNDKIDFIESLPEADTIIVIWVKLLTMAGKCNANGFIFLTEKIPYTEEMLAHSFKRPLNTVKLALETLRRLEMINFDGEILRITNWDKHQNVEGLDKIREQTRKRVAEHRERKKLELLEENTTPEESNVTSNVTITQSNAIEEEEEEELEEDKEHINILAPSDTAPSRPENPEPIEAEIITEKPRQVFIKLQLIGDKEHEVTEDDIILFKEAYPAVNIEQELRKMKGWLFSNPTKRKTSRGINAFINRWLCREQDRGQTYPSRPANTQRTGNNFYDLMQDEEFMNGGRQ